MRIDFTEICNATHCSKSDIAQTMRELGVKRKLDGELNGDFYKKPIKFENWSVRYLFQALDSNSLS